MPGGGADEDVVEAFGAGVGGVGCDGDGVAVCEGFLLRLAPAPGVQHAVAGGAVFGEVVGGGGDGATSSAFDGVVPGADG